TGADGLTIYLNQQWVDYTGLTLEESYGEGWITPFHPDDRQRAWDAWQRATQHRDTYSLECRLRRADGVYQWWLIRGVPLLSANRQHVERFAAGAVTVRQAGERLITIAGLRKNGEEFPGEAAISKLRVGEKTLLTVAMRDVTERKRLEKEQQFLAEVSVVLSASLDSEQTLSSIADLVVQNVADWCTGYGVDGHGNLSRHKVAISYRCKAKLCGVLE